MSRVTAGFLAAALVLAGGACSGDDDDGDRARPRRTTTSTTSEVVSAGEEIRLGVPEEPASLDPFDVRSRTGAGLAVLGMVLPQLFRVDPAGEAQGWLVDDASLNEEERGPDGTFAVSFSLRKGAKWSDRTPITADDLRFTLETVRSTAWPGPGAGYERLRSVDGDGGDVRFVFDGPFPGWRRLFSGNDFVLPAHRLRGKHLTQYRDQAGEWSAGPDVAGGPFRLGPVTRGLEVVLERHQGWWGGAVGTPRLRVTVVPDSRTMEQLLERGELDVVWPVAESNRTGRYRALEGVDVSVAEPGGRIQMLVGNTESVAPRDRAAWFGLVPRDRFVDVLLAGEARRAESLAGRPGAGDAAIWAGDLMAGAPKLAKDSKVTVIGEEEDPISALLGRVLEAGAYDRSATVELKFADAVLVEGKWFRRGEFDLALLDEMTWPEPCWGCWFAPRSPANHSRVKTLGDLAAAADRGDAGSVVALEQALRAQSVVLPLWRPATLLAGKSVEGLEANSWSVGPFWHAERWKLVGQRVRRGAKSP